MITIKSQIRKFFALKIHLNTLFRILSDTSIKELKIACSVNFFVKR